MAKGKKVLLSTIEANGFADKPNDEIYDFKAYDQIIKAMIGKNLVETYNGFAHKRRVKIRVFIEIEDIKIFRE
jgi:hypothetical protein